MPLSIPQLSARRTPATGAIARPGLAHLIGNFALPYDVWRTSRSLNTLAAAMPSGDGRPVMLIPGLLASGRRMEAMRHVLLSAGYGAHDWGLGRNCGPRADILDRIDASISAIARNHGAPVTLVGWSLGGLYAREYAKTMPHRVRGIVTMGTPFSGDPRANHAWRIYEKVAGFPVDAPPFPCRREEKPPVPTIALWSRRDGVIQPDCAAGQPEERDRAIEVDCTHMGFAAAPEGIAAVGRALALLP